MEEKMIDDACSVFERSYYEFTDAWLKAFRETAYGFKRLTRELKKETKRLNCLLRGGKRPKYVHTGINPKRQNRTRKKQRLTRLQRRWKRQRR